MPDPFPWRAAMAFGFGRLQLSSRDFWALTPRELAAAVEAERPPGARIDRAALERLLRDHPDEPRR